MNPLRIHGLGDIVRDMTEELFTKMLREFIHRRPFIPFVVLLRDGTRLTIDSPSVVFSGPSATFMSEDNGFVEFSCEQVQSMDIIVCPPATCEGAPMSEEAFFTTLREYTRRKPFVPFVVELSNGGQIVVDYPSVAFSGGAAGFINEKGILERFACEEVRSIHPASTQAVP